jgi:hypothetical protein
MARSTRDVQLNGLRSDDAKAVTVMYLFLVPVFIALHTEKSGWSGAVTESKESLGEVRPVKPS